MLMVREVFAEGHDHFTGDQLNYVRSMANRVGFTVVNSAAEAFPAVVEIHLNVGMTNPVFKALVEDTVSTTAN